jgi:hypothetical protein
MDKDFLTEEMTKGLQAFADTGIKLAFEIATKVMNGGKMTATEDKFGREMTAFSVPAQMMSMANVMPTDLDPATQDKIMQQLCEAIMAGVELVIEITQSGRKPTDREYDFIQATLKLSVPFIAADASGIFKTETASKIEEMLKKQPTAEPTTNGKMNKEDYMKAEFDIKEEE